MHITKMYTAQNMMKKVIPTRFWIEQKRCTKWKM